MSKTILEKVIVSDPEILSGSEEDTDFTLNEHYKERIAHHQKMLLYYLNEQRNKK